MPPLLSLPPAARARGVTAVLGPTNTGKTHLALERMLGHSTGVIGLPLRLLAREVYGRLVDKAGEQAVALITGEEKIKPANPRYWVATTEAMPKDLDVAFVAVDECQLGADFDRGHVFTDALLNRRGREETLIIGSATMRPLVEALMPGVTVTSRPRLSKLSFAGEKKLTRLPPRAAIVAFSAEEVYAIAELIRRQRGGAAVVMGALSPRTRNAQVALFQNGDVDTLVATDAIGMGLNLDIDHVAFAADRKFDGHIHRRLTPAEVGQIAGRAGRHLKDGTFGTSGRCPPFDPELIAAVEDHRFETIRTINWRNPDLDASSAARLRDSLAVTPREPGLVRAPRAMDEIVFEIAAGDPDVADALKGPDGVRRLWEIAALPDYRKVAPQAHAELVAQVFGFMAGRKGVIPDDWFERQVNLCDRVDGDIDTLSARIAQVRTWTFCANRDWLADPLHWQGRTRAIEDKLSDALHERLAARFVDRRTSVLMRRLRENAIMQVDVTPGGDVTVEGQHVGQLLGFRFTPDAKADGAEAKALMAAAQKALAGEIEARAKKLSEADDTAFALALDGTIRWTGEPVGRLQAGEHVLSPRVIILADEQLTGAARDQVDQRLQLWIAAHVTKLLGPLQALESGEGLEGIARGIAYRVAESLGVLDRAAVAKDMKALDQTARAELRKRGLRFGAYHIYTPMLLKPAPRALAAQLWALKHGGPEVKGLDDIAHLSASGRTTFVADETVQKALYRAAGFRVAGKRAIRVDILERLADLIRPAIAYRPGVTSSDPPPGAHEGDGFTVTVAMTSLAGCAGEDFAEVLRALGYRMDRKPPMPPPAPKAVPPAGEPVDASADTAGEMGAAGQVSAGAVDDSAVAIDDAASHPSAAPPLPPEPLIGAPEPLMAATMEPGAGATSVVNPDPAPEPLLVAMDTASDETGTRILPAEDMAAARDGADAAPVLPADIAGEAEPMPAATMDTGAGGAMVINPDIVDASAPQEGAPAEAAQTDMTTDGPAQVEPVLVEPILVEVWRPGRMERQGGDQRPPRGERRGRPGERGQGDRAAGDRAAGERPEGARFPRRGPPQRQGQSPRAGDGTVAPSDRNRPPQDRTPGDRLQTGGQGGPPADRSQGERRPFPRRDGDRPRDDRARQDRRPREGGERGDRPDRGFSRDDRNRESGPALNLRFSTESRGRGPDPSSPFAQLAALKAQLEGRGNQTSTAPPKAPKPERRQDADTRHAADRREASPPEPVAAPEAPAAPEKD
jgi:ATP-dependent RNA helicase SUPV3L1/SUV3